VRIANRHTPYYRCILQSHFNMKGMIIVCKSLELSWTNLSEDTGVVIEYEGDENDSGD